MRVIKRLGNPLQDRLYILQYFMIPKPQHAIALLDQEIGSLPILLLAYDMLPSIDLEHQMLLRTAEIRNEGTYGMLPPKFRGLQASVTQLSPKFTLRLSLIPAQPSGTLLCFCISHRDDAFPSPRPLPIGERGFRSLHQAVPSHPM